MRFAFFACLFGLGVAAMPASAQPNYLRVRYDPAPTVTPVVTGGPACPDAMVLRSFHLDTPVRYANFDPIYTVRPKKKITVRRAGQNSDTQDIQTPTPQFIKSFSWSDHNEKPADLRLLIDMRFCEGLDTIRVADGQLSITGQIGHYQIRYETALSGNTEDEIHMYWRSTALFTPEPGALGHFVRNFKDRPFNARYAETKNHISGPLGLSFNVQFMPESNGQ